MSSDPRRGLFIALAVMAICAAWFIVLTLNEAPIRDALGMNRHAITFAAITLLIFAAAAAFVFARFAAVREELLAGRRVLGRWHVDSGTWNAIAPKILAADERDKRSAAVVVVVLLIVVFGLFALADPDAAVGMMSIALLVAVAVVVAHLVGRRVEKAHWRYRGGEVIIGERGVLSNGVLHVWALPLNRLRGAALGGRPPVLTVAYAWFGRHGWQEASVDLPVARDAAEIAARSRDALSTLASTGRVDGI
ncbi:MAG: hypothetical protein OEL76_05900 [Siculibacillus sp.]|nr:hypothetical protein [Siculibacillus sp.]